MRPLWCSPLCRTQPLVPRRRTVAGRAWLGSVLSKERQDGTGTGAQALALVLRASLCHLQLWDFPASCLRFLFCELGERRTSLTPSSEEEANAVG